MMMVQGFLLVALLAGSSWGIDLLPLEIDNALVTLGKSDLDLKGFYQALVDKAWPKVADFYSRLPQHAKDLKALLPKLKKASQKPGIKVFGSVMALEVNSVLFKLTQIINNPESQAFLQSLGVQTNSTS